MLKKLKVGDEVFAHDSRGLRVGSVVKVGTKYAYLATGQRINLHNMRTDDGYGWPIYRSKEEYAETVRRARAGSALRDALRYRDPGPNVSTEDILAAAKLLQIEIKVDEVVV